MKEIVMLAGNADDDVDAADLNLKSISRYACS